MDHKVYNVLFLCTGNSARSIMAEASLQRWGPGKFKAYSAGSQPKGELHPMTVKILKRNNFNPDDFSSKSWDEFAKPDAPELDFVFTVCDNAASEVCPAWPGQPMSAHWGVTDPAGDFDSEDRQWYEFQIAFHELDNRIKIFTSLPFESLDRLSLQNRLEEIGKTRSEDMPPQDKSA
ncbi:MAG: arsenate reductase ArsC [Pirellulales bacterium]|nr:arsenate reductase ArsC [Pirellulales bacterium]